MAYDRMTAEEPAGLGTVKGAPEIQTQLAELEKAAEYLTHALDRMRSRMAPVLGPERPAIAEKAVAGRSPQTALGQSMAAVRGKFAALAESLTDLTDRIEL